MAERSYRRKLAAVLERRTNLTSDEFVFALADDCEPDVAIFLWEELLPYFEPMLTPHPDDDFINHVPIDHDEPNDWLAAFCKRNGLHEKDFTDWSDGNPSTIRNFSRWLSANRRRLLQP